MNEEIASGSSFKGDLEEMMSVSLAEGQTSVDLMLVRQRIWGSWLTSGKQSEIPPSLLLGDHNSQSDVPYGIPCWRKMAEIWERSCGVLGTLLSPAPTNVLLSRG